MSKTLGQVAFEAYVHAVGGKDVRDQPIPAWKDVLDNVKEGWEAAARAVESVNLIQHVTVGIRLLDGLLIDKEEFREKFLSPYLARFEAHP